MARTAAPSPPTGQGRRRKHGGRRSRSAVGAITGLFLAGVMLLGAATLVGVSHLGSADRAAVRITSPPSVYGHAAPPVVPAAPAPKPAATHRPGPRKQVPGAPVPTGVRGVWRLAFDDEFSGTSLDRAKWSTGWYGSGITPPVNAREKECYDPAQVTEGGGALALALIRKSEDCGISDPVYATGLVSTRGKFGFTYGFIEARAWLPAMAGDPGQVANWPAVWADGESWPEDGEIDIVEGLGGEVSAHFHGPADPDGVRVSSPKGNYAGGWHTFAADWEPGIVTYYYDGVDIGSVTSGITSAPMFLILSYGTASLVQAPATMRVDYLRVWRHP
jgi:hypothetical protein